MKERKQCLSCNEYLISFQGNYLHPEKPCAGILDYIQIEAYISDEVMHKKFVEMYGVPEMSDSERLTLLEKNPIIRFLSKLIKK